MEKEKQDPKQVIVVRHDLNMRKGKLAAQVAHASMKVVLDTMIPVKTFFKGQYRKELRIMQDDPMAIWLKGSFAKVVVRVESEEELIAIENRAMFFGLRTARIIDSGRTEFHGNPTLTCVAIGPDMPYKIDKVTGHLKLM